MEPVPAAPARQNRAGAGVDWALLIQRGYAIRILRFQQHLVSGCPMRFSDRNRYSATGNEFPYPAHLYFVWGWSLIVYGLYFWIMSIPPPAGPPPPHYSNIRSSCLILVISFFCRI